MRSIHIGRPRSPPGTHPSIGLLSQGTAPPVDSPRDPPRHLADHASHSSSPDTTKTTASTLGMTLSAFIRLAKRYQGFVTIKGDIMMTLDVAFVRRGSSQRCGADPVSVEDGASQNRSRLESSSAAAARHWHRTHL